MLITTLELQKEPLLFREEIAEGAIDYAPDTRQVGALPVEGKADLIVEHRGPQEEVEDIRVRASYDGAFEVLCARCVEPVAVPLKGDFDLLFRPEGADAEAGERAISEDETEIGYYGKERPGAGGRRAGAGVADSAWTHALPAGLQRSLRPLRAESERQSVVIVSRTPG